MELSGNLVELKKQYDELKPHLTPDEKKKIRQLLGLEPPDFIDWVQSEFYIPETRSPMVLYEWDHVHNRPSIQQAAIREAMKTDDEGLFVYSTVLWGDIKKSAKTAIGAARALYTAIFQDFAMVRVIGNDKDQSESRLFYYIVRCLKLNQPLAERIGARIIRNKIYLANNSYIEAIAVDPEGEAGGGDDLTVFTELWGARTQAHVKLWTETTLSPIKYGRSQRWCESYAGVRGDSPLLENLYDKCVVEGNDQDKNNLGGEKISKEFPFFTDATHNIFCLWNREPHLPWQTKKYYDNERTTLLEPEFIRVHRNTFLTSQQRYVEDEKLKPCYGDMYHLTPESILILASDAGYSNNSYGLVGVVYDKENDLIRLAFEHMWESPGKGMEIDLSAPEKMVKRLAIKYTVLVWTYDPYQLKRTAQALESDPQNPINTHQFIQQGKRSIADKALLDRISTCDIIFPENSLTVQHLKNADMKIINTDKVRIVRRQGPTAGHVDLAVCLSMAVYVAVSEGDKFPAPTRFDSAAGSQVRQYSQSVDSRRNPLSMPLIDLPPDMTMGKLPAKVFERYTNDYLRQLERKNNSNE